MTYYKPVIVLGKSIYSHKGATYDIDEKSDIAPTLSEIDPNPVLPVEKKTKVDELVYYLLKHYLYFSDAEEVFANGNDEFETKIISQMATGIEFQGRQSQNIKGALSKTNQYLSVTKKLREELQNTTPSLETALFIITRRFDSLPQFTERLINQLGPSKCDYLVYETVDTSVLSPHNVNAIYEYSSQNMLGILECLLQKYDLVLLVSEHLEYITTAHLSVMNLVKGTRKLILDSFTL